MFASTRLTKKSNAIIHKLSCPFNVFTFTEKKKIITCTGGLTVKSDFTLNDCPKLDLLIIPGGIGTRILLKNNNILNWLAANKDINIIASVCTGSLLLAKAGLLDNKKATSHWGALELLKKLSPSTQILKNKKFVYDKYYTSAGVSAGINMSLHIIEKLLGKKSVSDRISPKRICPTYERTNDSGPGARPHTSACSQQRHCKTAGPRSGIYQKNFAPMLNGQEIDEYDWVTHTEEEGTI